MLNFADGLKPVDIEADVAPLALIFWMKMKAPDATLVPFIRDSSNSARDTFKGIDSKSLRNKKWLFSSCWKNSNEVWAWLKLSLIKILLNQWGSWDRSFWPYKFQALKEENRDLYATNELAFIHRADRTTFRAKPTETGVMLLLESLPRLRTLE